jgi:cyclopropane fatty-acyl-phospholipid synthase-like methyltransferase/methyltransferase-like protein
MSVAQQPTSYEDIPYIGRPYRETHLTNLAAMATLFGMTPAAMENCRVLELGCAAGGNLLPMAEAFPGAAFVGVDSSQRQIDDAKNDLRELGLSNVEFRLSNIAEIGASWGPFDYIIAHGVYSWVPPDVRRRVMEICSQNLTPQGVAYVSYNVYPGWHGKSVARELMLFRGRKIEDAGERIKAGRAALGLIAGMFQGSNDPYRQLIRREAEAVQASEDRYLFHDHLSQHNDPVWFYEFAAAAQEQGLQYLSEANPAVLKLPNPDAQRALQAISSDVIEIEQYMDFVRNRAFRQTLLCHADVALQRNVGPERLAGLHLSSPATPTAGSNGTQFHHPSGLKMAVTGALAKAAMTELAAKWPASVPFEDLLARAIESSGAPKTDRAASILGNDLLRICGAGGLEIAASPAPLVSQVSERPIASAVARMQARGQQALITNRRHQQVELPPGVRDLVPLLDGTRTVAELSGDGRLDVTVIEQFLKLLARAALLIG